MNLPARRCDEEHADLGADQSSGHDAMRVWLRFIRLDSRVRAIFAARLRELNLTVAKCDVLTTLSLSEGLSQQELATRLYVTKGNISSLLDKLVVDGYVERRPSPLSRRSFAIYLTAQGRQAAETALAAQKAFVLSTFARLSDDKIAALDSILLELRGAVLKVES
jgi:DNA-binding MarR family transcriptional regulator